MKLAAGVAVVLAIGAGLGTYFVLGGPSHERPPVPKTKQSPILEQAQRQGVIDSYRPVYVDYMGHWPRWRYTVDSGDIAIWHDGGFGGYGYTVIEFPRAQLAKATAIERIAHRVSPHDKIIFGPPSD